MRINKAEVNFRSNNPFEQFKVNANPPDGIGYNALNLKSPNDTFDLNIQTPVENKINNQGAGNNLNSVNGKKMNNKTKIWLGVAFGGLLLAGGIALTAYKRKKPPIANAHQIIQETQNTGIEVLDAGLEAIRSKYNQIISQFPNDKKYFEEIAKAAGLAQGEKFRLASIMGKSELQDLLTRAQTADFQVGITSDKIGADGLKKIADELKDFEGVRNLTYRINLHNHTQASDGSLSVKDLLEQARKWADKVAKKVGDDGKPPFTIAITDHDTFDGAKEAVKIISSDPEKFKNLRVVLGAEISVSHIDPVDVTKPFNFELLGYALNPFDKNLNGLLKQVAGKRTTAVADFLEKIKTKFPQYDLRMEDSMNFHKNLKNMRTNGVLDLTRKYAEFKIMLSDYVDEINKKIVPRGQKKLDANQIFSELGDNYYFRADAYGERDIKLYIKDHALKPALEKMNLFTPDNQRIYGRIFAEKNFGEQIDGISKVFKSCLPTITNTKGYCLEPDDVFNAAKKSEIQGFFGFAHPGLMSPDADGYSKPLTDYCTSNKIDWNEYIFSKLINKIKKKHPDLFMATEMNYQSYKPKIKQSFVDYVTAESKRLELVGAGGLDCHKNSIFLNHRFMEAEDAKRLDLQNIIGVEP